MKKTLQRKICLGTGIIVVLAALARPTYEITFGVTKQKMQKRQDAIVKNLCYNPLTRVSDEKEFMELYREIEKNYNK